MRLIRFASLASLLRVRGDRDDDAEEGDLDPEESPSYNGRQGSVEEDECHGE